MRSGLAFLTAILFSSAAFSQNSNKVKVADIFACHQALNANLGNDMLQFPAVSKNTSQKNAAKKDEFFIVTQSNIIKINCRNLSMNSATRQPVAGPIDGPPVIENVALSKNYAIPQGLSGMSTGLSVGCGHIMSGPQSGKRWAYAIPGKVEGSDRAPASIGFDVDNSAATRTLAMQALQHSVDTFIEFRKSGSDRSASAEAISACSSLPLKNFEQTKDSYKFSEEPGTSQDAG